MEVDDMKEEPKVKVELVEDQDEDTKRSVFDQVYQLIEEAKLVSSKAFKATKESAPVLFPSTDGTFPGQHYALVTAPLLNAIESLGVSLSELKSAEKTLFRTRLTLTQDEVFCLKNDETSKKENGKKERTVTEISNDFDEDDGDNDQNDDMDYDPADPDFVADGFDHLEDLLDDKDEIKKDLLDLDEDGTDKEGPYNCDQCDYTSTEARYLKQHKQRHKAGKYKCEICDYVIHKPYIMKSHMIKIHDVKEVLYICERENPEKRRYFCQQCSYSFDKKENLDNHVESKHMEKGKEEVEEEEDVKEDDTEYFCSKCPYVTNVKKYFEDHIKGIYKYKKCPLCPQHFSTSNSQKFSIHLKKDHSCGTETGHVRCPECGQEFDMSLKLQHHLMKSHGIGTKYHCPQCKYSSENLGKYKLHAVDHQTATFPCPDCGHLAKSRQRLEKHIYQNHASRKCAACDIVFKDKKEFTKHNRKNHPQVKICDICGYEASDKESLSRHNYFKHRIKNSNCEECNIIAANNAHLPAHKRKQLKIEGCKEHVFRCEYCDYSNTVKQVLQQHVKVKHLNWRLSCDLCSAKFTNLQNLKTHKLKHEGNEASKLRCKECEYSTYNYNNLNRHVEKVHQGIRWPCEECDYVGSYKADLSRHLKIVHQGFIMKCEMCDYSTSKKYSLKGHMLKVHGEER